MHFLILNASPADAKIAQDFAQAMRDCPLPGLTRLLRDGQHTHYAAPEMQTLSSWQEQMHARTLGWVPPLSAVPKTTKPTEPPAWDGLLPWAALQARTLGLPEAQDGEGWAWITPCHWQVNADHVLMHNPAALRLGADHAEQLLNAMRSYFEEDGLRLYPGAEDGSGCVRWLACGRALKDLRTASLEQVSDRAIDAWLPQSAALRRLQNEMQMLLYTHPVNDARAAQGLTPVNAFWISGTGSLPADWRAPTALQVIDLRALPLSAHTTSIESAADWRAAWLRLDQTILHALSQANPQALGHLNPATNPTASGAPNQPKVSAAPTASDAVAQASVPRLTLCSPRGALMLEPQRQGFWQRLQRRWATPNPAALLAAL